MGYKKANTAFAIVQFTPNLLLAILLGLIKGTPGRNKYGGDARVVNTSEGLPAENGDAVSVWPEGKLNAQKKSANFVIIAAFVCLLLVLIIACYKMNGATQESTIAQEKQINQFKKEEAGGPVTIVTKEVKNTIPVSKINPAEIKNDLNTFIADLTQNVFKEWKYESLMQYSNLNMAIGLERDSGKLKDQFESLIDKYGAIEDYATEIKAVKEINSPYGIFLLSEDCAIQAEFENEKIKIMLDLVNIGGKWQLSGISFNGFNYCGLSKEEIWYRMEKNANRPIDETTPCQIT